MDNESNQDFLVSFIQSFGGKDFFDEATVQRLSSAIQEEKEWLVANTTLFEKIFSEFSPADLVSGQINVSGYPELEVLLQEMCTLVRQKKPLCVA